MPSGLRTAIVILFGARIITPSTTAWPPTAKSISSFFGSSSRSTASMAQVRIIKFILLIKFIFWLLSLDLYLILDGHESKNQKDRSEFAAADI